MIEPLFESQTDHAIMYAFAKKFGFDKEFVKNYKIVKPDPNKMDEPEPESILREINKGVVDDRLHRAVAGAAEAAHEEHEHVRREDAARARAARATATTSACRGRATARRS